MVLPAADAAKSRWPGWLALGLCAAAVALILVGFPLLLQGLCALDNACTAAEARASATGAALAQIGLLGVLPGMVIGAVAVFTGRGRGPGACSLLLPLTLLALFWLYAAAVPAGGGIVA